MKQEILTDKPVQEAAELERIKRLLKKVERLYEEAAKERDALRQELRLLREQYETVSHSKMWRMTKPLRWLLDFFKKLFWKFPPTRLLAKTLRTLRRYGFRETAHKIKMHLRERRRRKQHKKRDWSRISASERTKQAATRFKKEVTFSILVPLYNTPIGFLNEMIQSVMAQTYANWELCLADGSDGKHPEVGETARRFAEADSRIKYCKLEKNLGISENTNACIQMATGNYIALFDHDDVLHPAALYEMMRAICEQEADFIYTDENTFSDRIDRAYCPHFKPDFSPDLLRSYNYICHFTAFSRSLLERVGGFRPEFDGSQDYDMILRLTEQARHIVHIPKILYFWRAHQNSVASDISAKPYTLVAARRALTEHLQRVGLRGTVEDSRIPSTYRIRYEIKGEPLVSIIIPNMDHTDVLKTCIRSVERLSTYPNYEILIVENNSRKAETFACYEELCRDYENVRVIEWKDAFNYSAINNFAAKEARGEYLLFLNNDIEIITPSWIEELLMFVQRPDVGAAGMMLYYPDDTVQHAGVILGVGGVAGHSHKYFARNDYGYSSRMSIAQNLSAVTAACLMMPASLFAELGGFDEAYAVAFNDVDLCMRIRRAEKLIVFTPYGEAYHHESKSRGTEDTPEKQARFCAETERFQARWGAELEAGDPYYNPNLSLVYEDFRLA